MTTSASIGYGVLLRIQDTSQSPAAMVSVGEQTNIVPPNISVDSIEATHSESEDGYKEFIPGMIDGGEVSAEVNYVPGDAGMTVLLASLRSVKEGEIEFPSGAKWEYSAFVTGIEPEAPVDDKMVATVTLKITGKPTFTPAA